MSEHRSKAELRRRMEAGLTTFLANLDRLTPEQLVEPVDAVGWNIRDHLTHLAVWADGIAALLRREDRWAAMGLTMADPEGDEPDYDAMNAELVEKSRHLTAAEARAWVVAAHDRVLAAVDALDEAELNAPYERFVAPFTGSWGDPIAEYVLGNTEDHCDEHTPWILAIAVAGDRQASAQD